jgi:hypothetical protein
MVNGRRLSTAHLDISDILEEDYTIVQPKEAH